MLTLGGAMSGYCSTGRVRIPAIPASMITIAITQANTGRSMKMRLIMGGAPSPALPLGAPAARPARPLARRRARGHRDDRLTGLDPVQALGDHLLAWRQAR